MDSLSKPTLSTYKIYGPFLLCSGDWRVFDKGKYDRDKFGSLRI